MSLTKRTFGNYLSLLKVTANTPDHCDLEFQPELYRLLNLRTSQGRRNIEQLLEMLRRECSKPKAFTKLKLVLLLHYLVLKFEDYRSWMKESPVNIPDFTQGLDSTRQISGVQKILHFAGAYYRLIQKYCFSDDIYDFSLRKARETNPAKAIERTYLLMNLIRESSPLLTEIIYFGRYHKVEYPIVMDVIRLMVRQLSILYESMFGCVYTLIRTIPTLEEEQIDQLLTILEEIPAVNEILITYLYNRYYYDEVTSVGIDVFHPDSRMYKKAVEELLQRKKEMKRAEIEKFDLSEFESTYFSMLEHRELTTQIEL